MHGAIALKKQTISERALAAVQPPVPASFPLGRRWFVACVFGGREAKAAKDIEDLGFTIFNPIQTITVIRRGRKVKDAKPIFPGYVFCRFDREREDWGKINDINGVIGIIENMQLPVPFPDIEMQRLKNWVDAGVFEKASALQIDDLVEIMEGPFAGEWARIKSATAKKRVKILLGMLKLEIDPCFLRKAL